MRGIYRAKHDFLLAELKKRSWVEKIYGDHAGLHVLVQVNTEKKETEICDLAEKQGIRIYGISEYVVRKSEQSCNETVRNKNASIESEKTILPELYRINRFFYLAMEDWVKMRSRKVF